MASAPSDEDAEEGAFTIPEYLFAALAAEERLKPYLADVAKDGILAELQLLIEEAGEDAYTQWSDGANVVSDGTIAGLVDLVVALTEDSSASTADVLKEAVSLLRTDLLEDERIQRLLSEIQGDQAGGLTPNSVVGDGVSGDEVVTDRLDLLVMDAEQARELQDAWGMYMESFSSSDVACDTLFAAFYDAAPSLHYLFKTNRAVMSGRFAGGIESIVMALPNGKEVKSLVELLGFKHLELEVTSPRIAVVREALLEAFTAELGDRFTTLAYEGLRKTLNYAGGGCIYLRETFAERLQILASSWRTASANGQVQDDDWEDEHVAHADSARGSGSQTSSQMESHIVSQDKASQSMAEVQPPAEEEAKHEIPNKISMQGVPTSFDDMFRFNAAVMGMADREWMYEVLDCFDAIVRNVANSFRLQEECDVLSLRFAKLPGVVILTEFKAVMLASLRSLVPQDWDTKHEEAWDWLWSNVEKILGKELGKAAERERRVSRYVGSMEDETKIVLSRKIYAKFFAVAPEGQNYFKQSSTRLQFIIDRVVEMTLSMYQFPCRMVDEISALGLRHVGYGIPTEFFNPFVQCCVEVMREVTNDEKLCDGFGWSLGLISRVLVRTINEGSTLVMKAINLNSANMVKKALTPVPRAKRALCMLKITVGTQSISPLLWAISSGNLEAAHEILEDLLTIRADRDRYYFGNDDLFSRHPDIVQVLTKEAPTLLEVLLDKLVWRSRVVVGGQRRVNFFIKHLLVDADGQFAGATQWICQMQDPVIVVHCVLETLTDLVWTNVIYGPFLRSKVWLLFTLLVFLMSQSILKTWHAEDEATQGTLRIATAVCRAFVYFASMLELIYSRTRITCKAIRDGEIVRRCQIPVPSKVITDWQESMSWLLTLILIAMFMVEPVLYCLQADSDFPDAGLFTQNCSHTSSVFGSAPSWLKAARSEGVNGAEDDVYFVSVSYRGTAYDVQGDDQLASIFDFVQEALDFPRENCKLIFRGKVLRPDNDSQTVAEAGLAAGCKVMLVASSAKDVSFVQSSRADPLVKGFAEEERDEQSRRKRARAALSAWGTKQDSEFNFGSIKAEFKYSEPPPYEAERLLQKLSTDPGIIEIMKTRKFKVGVLTEMSPVEAQDRMAKRGTPNMDLLGYNQNYGGMIVLRLRTDTLKGFRPYHDLINTLIHELTHNVWGPHDNNFWKLFGELKAQYMRFHRFWSHGGRAADSNAAGQFQGFEGDENAGKEGSFGRVLGSSLEAAQTDSDRRSRALAAAEARMGQTEPELPGEVQDPEETVKPWVPNFLASNGQWMFACPCGETHTVSTEEKEALISALVEGATTCLFGAASSSSRPVEMEQDPQHDAGNMEQFGPTAGELPTTAADREIEPEAAQQREEIESSTANPPPQAVSEKAPAQTRAAPAEDLPPLDLSELELQGLDGAAVWLKRFSEKLSGLAAEQATKAAAVELLLKLVRNVVKSPDEQKFRRIRTENPAIRSRLITAGGERAEALMTMLGFEPMTESNGERVFVLRDASFDYARLRMGQELLEAELDKMTVTTA
ncbi:wss2 [Symbiodinium necroappetens]|uniref:Wss2 protein n=1 Tax=Symbiodinium necroappetens TaxID=1628268 RepID=A0A812IWB8_9DINO|nr:wss2 [Symbiodinium necroappetens]